MRSLTPKYRLLLRATFVVAIASVMGLNMPTQQGAVAQTNEDAYRQLSLFGDVFERVRGEYVEEKTDKELIEAAINGICQMIISRKCRSKPRAALVVLVLK